MENALPYDATAEDAVLGSVITNPGEYETVARYFTDSSVFYQKRARLLWNKIKQMVRSKQTIDTLSVCMSVAQDDINKGLTKHYITGCTSETCVKGMTEFYANKLYEKYLLRKIIVKAEDIKMHAEDNEKDIYKVISETHSVLSELMDVRPSAATDIEDIIAETVDSVKNKTSKLIKTGYHKIDAFSGGLTRGEITIIGGRPGHGKTTVMINMLANILENNYKAIFFSRELPNSELVKKIVCLESGKLSYGQVRKNIWDNNSLKHFDDSLAFVRKKYASDRFLMFDNVRDFAASSSEVKKFKPDIIFDDYIQLIACDSREDQRRLQIEKLVNDYKWLAKETDAVVVLASQLNRMIERAGIRGKALMPQLSDLAESGAIEQVAENVFFSYYDYKVRGEQGKGKNILTISAGKVRYGDSGDVDLAYDGNKCKIHNDIGEMIDVKAPEQLKIHRN
jgi:replicative DNA helicase